MSRQAFVYPVQALLYVALVYSRETAWRGWFHLAESKTVLIYLSTFLSGNLIYDWCLTLERALCQARLYRCMAWLQNTPAFHPNTSMCRSWHLYRQGAIMCLCISCCKLVLLCIRPKRETVISKQLLHLQKLLLTQKIHSEFAFLVLLFFR